ncbi:hypothetical protein CkaCkLH20_11501 [Colletotrichum karsti]|uniref:HIT-type domain-containing protein n=1 Tax=Colletotrichum karsti TaxID=1095194 RepID=A0A9P6HVA6_9PEZI|nr:uncharacterized protein CkaCkLH20_11501 [Colletotrichum karsti]KAF9871084.1 hypothetical protein CkaCkLH20_11501 [Colletotrichum karsti]
MDSPSSSGIETPSSSAIETSSSSSIEELSSAAIEVPSSDDLPVVVSFSVQLEASGIQPTAETTSGAKKKKSNQKTGPRHWKLHHYPVGVFRTFGRPKNKKNYVCGTCLGDVKRFRFPCNNCGTHFCSLKCFNGHHDHNNIPMCFWVRRPSLLHDTPPNQSYRAIVVGCNGRYKYIWLKASFDKVDGILSFETDCEEIISYVDEFEQPRIRCLNINTCPEAAGKLAYGLDVITFNSNETQARQSRWINQTSARVDPAGAGNVCPVSGPAIIFAYDVVKDKESADEKTFGAFIAGRHATFKEIQPFAELLFFYEGRPGWSSGTSITLHALKVSDTSHDLMQSLGVGSQFEEIFAHANVLVFFVRPRYPLFRAFCLGLRWYIRSSQPFHQSERVQYSNEYGDLFETFEYTIHDSSPVQLRRFKKTGSFQIFQVNGGNVKPHHVRAMSQYFSTIRGTGERASENGFRKYWEQYKKERKGTDINSIDSPYDLEKDDCGFDPDSVKTRKNMQEVAKFVTVWIAESNKNNWDETELQYVSDKMGSLTSFAPGLGLPRDRHAFIRDYYEVRRICADNWVRLLVQD